MKQTKETTGMAKALEETRSEFIEKIGVMAQGDGLPRIAGRLLGMLIWDGNAISFGDLAIKLQVSRASISTATRNLEERRLIKRTAKPGERQDYLQIADKPYVKMMESVVDGMEAAKTEIRDTLDSIPKASQGVRDRVQAYADFYDVMSEAAQTAAKKLG